MEEKNISSGLIGELIFAYELEYIRSLGQERSLKIVASNLGAYEAVLLILASGNQGVPIYNLLQSMKSNFCSQSGLLKRLRILRSEGVILDSAGSKKSEVYLRVCPHFKKKVFDIIQSKSRIFESNSVHFEQAKHLVKCHPAVPQRNTPILE